MHAIEALIVNRAVWKGQILQACRGHSVAERKGTDYMYVSSTRKNLHSTIVMLVHAH